MAKLVQVRAITAEFTGQLSGGDALGDPAEDEDQLRGAAVGAPRGRAGEGVEDAAAVAAAVIEHRCPMAAMDGDPVGLMATRAGQPAGVEGLQELGVVGVLVHHLGDREVQGRLRMGDVSADLIAYNNPRAWPQTARHRLDSGPTGLASNPRESESGLRCTSWLQALHDVGDRVMTPEIAVNDSWRSSGIATRRCGSPSPHPPG